MAERIIIRPMYRTDPKYIKGMEAAILESTGEIIKRNFDNVLIHIPKSYEGLPVYVLTYDEVDWELAGYKIKK